MAVPPNFIIWPARYKASIIEIHEAAGYRPWIAASEVSKVLPTGS
jgi:hypothetical protein